MLSLRAHLSASDRRRRSRGMTLIEILIVLAISALLIGGVATGLGAGRQAEVSRATNQLANTVRFAFNKARVTGSYYRLLIKLDDSSFSMQRGADKMYLPATDRYGRIKVVDPSREKEKEERDRRAEENYNRSIQARVLAAVKGPSNTKSAATPIGAPSKAAPTKAGAPGTPTKAGTPTGITNPAGGGVTGGMIDRYTVEAKKVPRRKPPIFGAFDDDNSLSELKNPFKLPKTVMVVSVQTADDLKPITTGEASIYFFPQGHTQLAHIQVEEIEHPENSFTIIIKPLTGRVEVKEGKINLALTDDPNSIRDDLGRRQTRRSF
jgi:general secretion pathway protein H